MSDASTALLDTPAAEAAEDTLLDRIVRQSRVARSDQEHGRARELIARLVQEVMDGTVVVSENLGATLDARIADIDALLSEQLSEVLHHPEFQKLDATWRGLHYLCRQSSTGPMLKIKLFNATKRELVKDFNVAVEFDQSALFRKVYEEEFGMFGGAPFGALIGDFYISRQQEDMYFIEQMSRVAAAAHAPFISAASPELFGLESYTDLGKPRDMARIFDTLEYVKWKSFRESEDARYVGLTMPRFLGRLPYHPKDGLTTEGFSFVEDVDGSDHSKYLWVNSAYAFAARLTAAFRDYGWCAAIRGVEGGGLVEDLPTHTFKTDEGEVALKCPTEVAITDRREKELSDLGFMTLVHCKHTDYAAFFCAQSAQKTKRYDTDAANANAALSAQMQYMFAVCRIAHYLKSIMREKIGSSLTPAQTANFLKRWISAYVIEDDNATQEAKARYPLRAASVDVTEVAGKPGVYRAVAFIRPHFQLDELSISLRLVAELPATKG
jgi:type VI secretion system protein ImpC